MKKFPPLLPVVALVSTAAAQPPAPPPLPGTRTLARGGLVVEVMDPAAPGRYHTGARFSPVANVLRARLGGREFLFAPAEHDPLRDNGGLAMEFDLQTPGGPPGFAEAAIGGCYLKIGVGTLRKRAENYEFHTPQELVEPARTAVEWGDGRAVFRQVCAPVNGYACALTAEVLVGGARVEVRCVLENTGGKPFGTEHYAHNYFLFDGAPVGPGCRLKFPFEFEAGGLGGGAARDGREIIFTAVPAAAVNLRIAPPAGAPNRVAVSHALTGQRVLCRVSRPASRVAVHATARYLCPEQFVRITLAPGEKAEWTRSYDFSTGDSPCREGRGERKKQNRGNPADQ
ncbi:MAG: hypothetical protein LBC18_01770 [Opitutaceae bacterium]|nr:hypothetical protein [Opitutaceae bacterium]